MIVYKPYKHKATEWSNDIGNSREMQSGRQIFCVGIGQRIIKDDTTGQELETEEIMEEVYKDILLGIFGENSAYKIKTTLGHTPGLIVTYDNRLIMHNDSIPGMVKKIEDTVEKLDKTMLGQAIANFTNNANGKEKKNQALKKVTAAVNRICETNYPEELIMYVIRDYCCDVNRSLSETEEQIHEMTLEELMYKVSEIVFKSNSIAVEEKEAVVNEILFRLLQGDIAER